MKRLLIVLLVLGGLSLTARQADAQILFPRLRLGVNNLALRAQNFQLRNELAFRDNLAFSRSLRFRNLSLADEIRLQNRLRRRLDFEDFRRRQVIRDQIRRDALRRELRLRNRLRLGADCF